MTPVFARVMFGLVNFAARKGIYDSDGGAATNVASKKLRARSAGIRGEVFAYWYLRRHGYIVVARNYKVPGLKGEIDLIAYDGEMLAFVEVKTRSLADNRNARGGGPVVGLPVGDARDRRMPAGTPALPEDAVNNAKRRAISRMARAYLKSTRRFNHPYRFDILAIEARAGQRPIVRLHKDAFAERS